MREQSFECIRTSSISLLNLFQIKNIFFVRLFMIIFELGDDCSVVYLILVFGKSSIFKEKAVHGRLLWISYVKINFNSRLGSNQKSNIIFGWNKYRITNKKMSGSSIEAYSFLIAYQPPYTPWLLQSTRLLSACLPHFANSSPSKPLLSPPASPKCM